MKKLLKALLLTLSLALALTGCGAGGSNESTGTETANNGEPQSGGTYVMVSSGEPMSFNPNWKTDDMALPAIYNLFNRLVKITVDNSIVPDLATSWEFSEDGKRLTFHLRENVKWHDGEPMTSSDVVWTFTKILSGDGYQAATLSNVESVTAEDDYTVTFNLSTPDASILGVLSWLGVWIMPEHLYANEADWTQSTYNMNPVGTGPFKFVEYDTGVSITLEKNEDYWDGAPYIDTLIISIIPDAETAYQAYINGELDDIQGRTPTASIQDLVKDTENYSTYTYVSTARTYLSFNINEDNPFGNILVREAVNLAIDRQAVVDKAAKGMGASSEYYISPIFSWALNDDAKVPERDVEAAKAKLEEAGYTMGSDGYYFSAELTTFDSGDFKDTAYVIQDNLKEIGINLTIDVREIGAWMSKVIDNYDFDIAMCSGGQGPDVSAVRNRVYSTGSLNLTKYANPELDRLFDGGVTVFDEADRAPYYKQIQEIMAKDLPIVVIKDGIFTYPVKNYIHNHPYTTEMSSKYGAYEMAKVWMEQ